MVKVSREVAEENRQALAKAADVLSRRHGLGKVGIAEIAKHAKLTTGAVYARFGSREDLLAAGIQAGFDRMIAWLETIDSCQAYREQVRAKGRLTDGALWCPAMSHIGSIREASAVEQAAYAKGLSRMLTSMARWPDMGSREHAAETLAATTGYMLFADLPTEDWHA